MSKIIAKILPPTSGKIEEGSNMHLSYYAQNQSELIDLKSTVMQVMEDKAPEEMRSRIRNVLGSFLFSGDDAEKKVSVLSGGERARLAMASLIMKPCNFLILDEPTNHLDIYSKEILKSALKDYQGTLLVISHDREFLAGLTSKVVEFKDGKTREFLGDIEYFLGKKKLDNMRAGRRPPPANWPSAVSVPGRVSSSLAGEPNETYPISAAAAGADDPPAT